jgi:hypothetical protein
MEIGPIPNAIPMRMAAPSAAPADVPTTRAIDLRRQQEQDDATYTPSGRDQRDDQRADDEVEAVTALKAGAEEALGDLPGEAPSESTISVFA